MAVGGRAGVSPVFAIRNGDHPVVLLARMADLNLSGGDVERVAALLLVPGGDVGERVEFMTCRLLATGPEDVRRVSKRVNCVWNVQTLEDTADSLMSQTRGNKNKQLHPHFGKESCCAFTLVL